LLVVPLAASVCFKQWHELPVSIPLAVPGRFVIACTIQRRDPRLKLVGNPANAG
jgi:hypothetical protein